RSAALKEGDVTVGNRTRAKIVKNKLAPPFREAEFDIIYGTGISREGDLIDLGVESKVVEKSGAWFNFKDTRLGQGRENSRNFLRDNPDVAQTIENEVRARLGVPAPTYTAAESTSAELPKPRKGDRAERG